MGLAAPGTATADATVHLSLIALLIPEFMLARQSWRTDAALLRKVVHGPTVFEGGGGERRGALRADIHSP